MLLIEIILENSLKYSIASVQHDMIKKICKKGLRRRLGRID